MRISTLEQDAKRKETSLKILESMLSEQKKYYKNQPPKDLNRRFEYDLKIMALSEGIEALGRQTNKTGITFPILNNLTPNVHSCTLKVMEEVGELMQKLGKGQGASGEKTEVNRKKWAVETVCEAIDTAQSAITLADILCKKYDFDLEELMELHESKLKERGYLK